MCCRKLACNFPVEGGKGFTKQRAPPIVTTPHTADHPYVNAGLHFFRSAILDPPTKPPLTAQHLGVWWSSIFHQPSLSTRLLAAQHGRRPKKTSIRLSFRPLRSRQGVLPSSAILLLCVLISYPAILLPHTNGFTQPLIVLAALCPPKLQLSTTPCSSAKPTPHSTSTRTFAFVTTPLRRGWLRLSPTSLVGSFEHIGQQFHRLDIRR